MPCYTLSRDIDLCKDEDGIPSPTSLFISADYGDAHVAPGTRIEARCLTQGSLR